MRLVVLPGMDGGAALSARFRDALSHDCDVEAVEYPRDAAPPMRELAEAIAARIATTNEPTILLGESYSGPVAVLAASHRPAPLRGLILAFSFARSPAPAALRPFIGASLFRRPPPRWAVRRWMLDREASADSVDAVRSAIARVPASTMSARARATLSTDVTAELRGLELPIFCLRASRDRMVRPGAAPERHADIACEAIDAPHLGLHAAPERCAAMVRERLGAWSAA